MKIKIPEDIVHIRMIVGGMTDLCDPSVCLLHRPVKHGQPFIRGGSFELVKPFPGNYSNKNENEQEDLSSMPDCIPDRPPAGDSSASGKDF